MSTADADRRPHCQRMLTTFPKLLEPMNLPSPRPDQSDQEIAGLDFPQYRRALEVLHRGVETDAVPMRVVACSMV